MASEEVEGTANEFSGTADAVVQAGTVHGDIHFHKAEGTPLPKPSQLPFDIAGFVDREPSLAQLNYLLEANLGEGDTRQQSSAMVAAITGAPGVGKTALAVHWAHQIRDRFPDGNLYLDMRSYGSATSLSTEQALEIFLRSFNVEPDSIPIDLDERAAMYRSIIGNRRILIVLDNVASVKQIRHLLPGSNRCLLIVTSRGMLSSLVAREGVTRVTLDVLPPADAIRLLAEIVGEERIEADYEAAGRVAEMCSYLPLALRVVAERAAGRPHLSLRELAGELTDEQQRLDALASDEDDLINVRAVFSWSYRALTSGQQKAFRLLGLHPGDELSSAAAAALVGITTSTATRQLRELADVHLLQEIAPNRFRLHALLRTYSVERCQREVAQRDRTHAIRRMQSWYLHAADEARRVILPYSHAIPLVAVDGIHLPSLTSVADAMSWYERERLNILGVLQQAMDLGQYDLAWKLPVVADGFFELRSYWADWKQVHEEGLAAARIVGDRLGEASNLLCLGDAHWRIGDRADALACYEQTGRIAHDIGDQWLEGFSLRGAGLIHDEQGDSRQAVAYFERALTIFRAAGLRRGEGMSLLSIGKVRHSLGELESAAEHCQRAVDIFREINDRWSEGWGLMPLGQTCDDMGVSEAAENHLQAAIAIFQEFSDRRSEARSHDYLGSVYKKRGDIEQARREWVAALDLLDTVDDAGAESIRQKILELDS